MRLEAPLAALVLIAAAAPALAQDLREAELIMKSGKRLRGKVEDRGTVVLLVYPSGAQTELSKDLIEKIVYLKADDDSGSGKPKKYWVQVTTTDGRVIKGESREDGELLVITTKIGKTRAETRVRKSEILRQEQIPAEDEDEEDQEDRGPDLDRVLDYDARFLLERPSADWKILKKSLSPRIRAQMNHVAKNAFIQVSVRPLATPWGDGKDAQKRVQSDSEVELRKDFDRFNGLRVEQGELLGAPVFELRYSGVPLGEKSEHEFVEARFERNGLGYAVTAGAERGIFNDLLPALRRAMEGFSFTGGVASDEDGYADLGLGFSVARPASSWAMLTRPFDDKNPVELRNPDGRAIVKVVVTDSDERTSIGATNVFLKERSRSSKLTVEPEQKTIDRNGVPIEVFTFKGFEAGGVKMRAYRGAAALVGKKLIAAVGEAPDTDEDAARLQGEVQLALDRFTIHDPNIAAERFRRGAQALAAFTEGVDAARRRNHEEAVKKLTGAIQLFDSYARAFYLRALSHQELKKWKEYREDLEAAAKLDPGPEYQAAIAKSYSLEAQELIGQKKFPEAESALRRALKADPKDEGLRHALVAFYKKWWEEVKKNPPDAVKLLGRVDDLPREKELDRFLHDAYCELGEGLKNADKHKYAQAKTYAQRALRYDKESNRAKTLIRDCDKIEKELSAPKKR